MGGDENGIDMGLMVQAAKTISERFNCAFMYVHHCGKDESKGMRGHYSLLAGIDSEITVRRDKSDLRSVRIEKLRDGQDRRRRVVY